MNFTTAELNSMSDAIGQYELEAVRHLAKHIYGQREEVLRAFIAKYGFEPERFIQVNQIDAVGSSRWFVVRRTDEQMAELSLLASQL